MTLFQCGFRRTSRSDNSQTEQQLTVTPSHVPSVQESGLGRLEYDEVVANRVPDLADPSPSKRRRVSRGKYTVYTEESRAKIGKYALENGNERARVHFKTQFPNLKESTIRNFKKAYKEQLKKKAEVTALPTMHRGRPPLLMELDRRLLQFLNAVRARGGVVNSHVVRATADALIRSNHSPGFQHLQNFSMPRSWIQSVYKRMGYTRRMGTTGRPPVPKGLYDECRVSYLCDIEAKRKKYNIPPQLILNADQTPSSYVSVGKSTMAKRGEKSVSIKGLSDKRSITLTFVITLAGEFLPLQIIYGGKTDRCHPKDFRFPPGFCVSHNAKHWSNEEETIKLIDTVIVPYIVRKRSQLNLPKTQKALVIWDVFKGQITEKILHKLKSLDCEFVAVPPNMTHFFQPLDLTVNRSAKQFMRKQFIMYYSEIVRNKLENGESVEDIEVDLRLTAVKPLHARWLVSMYNFFTSDKGAQIIAKGWKKAGISGLLDGTTTIPCADPFLQFYSEL